MSFVLYYRKYGNVYPLLFRDKTGILPINRKGTVITMEQNNIHYSDESNLKVSEDVLATIAATTVNDVPGIHSLAPTPGKNIRRILGKKGEGNGISISFTEEGASVEINLIIRFGCKVNDVATVVQKRVKEAIETMTGIHVINVDVVIAGMKLETENKKKTK